MNITIKTGAEHMDAAKVTALLQQTYWAGTRTQETVTTSMSHSLCFGAFLPAGEQVGFARVITDHATTYYLCDVVVDPACRGMGVGSALLTAVTAHPALRPLRGILATRDAHKFYQKFGFTDGAPMFMQTPIPF